MDDADSIRLKIADGSTVNQMLNKKDF